MGVATAWHLARTGHEVVLLERFRPGHDRGASHGTSRIYRQTYASDSHVRLAAEALPLWRELERETGAELLRITGGIDHGDPARTAELAASLAAHGIAHHWLDAREAAARWPGMVFDGPVLHQPDRSGRLHADHAVASLAAAAVGHGARIRYATRANAVTVRGVDLVEVDTSGGPVRARRAVVTAGAWTHGLLRDAVPLPPLRVTQEQPAHLPARPGGPDVSRWPTFIHHTGPAAGWPGGVYGLAASDDRVKLGFHGVGPARDPEVTLPCDPAHLQQVRDYVEAYLPGLDPGAAEPVSCTYTSTEDSAFVLEREGPLVVGAGFSGHGFKFAPAIGRVLAELATDRISRSPLVGSR